MLEEKGYQNKDITFGIRPEDLHSEQLFIDASPNLILEAMVTVAELLEAETMLNLERDRNEFIAKIDSSDHSEPENKVELAVNMNKAQFFDMNTGENLQPVTKFKTVSV
ncbi:hypothetical protein HYQ40_05585 [Aerococcaceae bacterium DSM 111021]|nr:hypothetical protein [Aerococcaceae bacterium DSM 111021]